MSAYAEGLAFRYNQQLCRSDIEWAVGANGELYLRDRFDWTAQRTRELERKAEADRARWKACQRQASA